MFDGFKLTNLLPLKDETESAWSQEIDSLVHQQRWQKVPDVTLNSIKPINTDVNTTNTNGKDRLMFFYAWGNCISAATTVSEAAANASDRQIDTVTPGCLNDGRISWIRAIGCEISAQVRGMPRGAFPASKINQKVKHFQIFNSVYCILLLRNYVAIIASNHAGGNSGPRQKRKSLMLGDQSCMLWWCGRVVNCNRNTKTNIITSK